MAFDSILINIMTKDAYKYSKNVLNIFSLVGALSRHMDPWLGNVYG